MTVPGPTIAAPPAPPARPDSVRFAVQLWIAVIVLEIIATAARWNVVKASYTRQLTKFAEDHKEPSLLDSLDATFIAGMVIALLILVAIAATLMWFSYSGYSWARLLLGWVSAFLTVQLAFAVIGLFVSSSTDSSLPDEPTWAMVPTILGGVCAVGALASLMHRDSTAFCREAAAFRTAKRQNGFR